MNKMKIEIWSDVVCPFCYIGKKRFDKALFAFEHKDEIEVTWKTFLLNPTIKTDIHADLQEDIAKRKGMPLAQMQEMSKQITSTGAAEGIEFNFEKAKVVNTLKAHQYLHLAQKGAEQSILKDRLFQAYFSEGKNIDDYTILNEIAQEVGVDFSIFNQIDIQKRIEKEIVSDLDQANQLEIQGVPFFIIDRKYGISGAQSQETFEQALKISFQEWKEESQSEFNGFENGESCSIDSCE